LSEPKEKSLEEKANEALSLKGLECTSYFLQEEMHWMSFPQGKVTGKIVCPDCHARVGRYNWAGAQCSCGRWMVPFLSILKARVNEGKYRRSNEEKGPVGVEIVSYTCIQCRVELFTSDDVGDHEQGKGKTMFKWKKRDYNVDEELVKQQYI